MSNPFFYGNHVRPEQFIDRRRELRRIVGRVLNQGQSTAVVGEPCSGKTSLLEYLKAPETRENLYGAHSERLLFSYLDSQMLGGEFIQAYGQGRLHHRRDTPGRRRHAHRGCGQGRWRRMGQSSGRRVRGQTWCVKRDPYPSRFTLFYYSSPIATSPNGRWTPTTSPSSVTGRRSPLKAW